MIVKAAVGRHPARPLVIETLELDEPRDDEILVRLIASGVGPADLAAIASGRPIGFPFVAGCEGAGIVERVGADVEGIAPGDTVVLTRASCGRCAACRAGAPRDCAERDLLNASGCRLDGSLPFTAESGQVHGRFEGLSSFATHVVCLPACATKIASDAPLEVLACLGGTIQDAAGAVLHGLRLSEGGTIVITGAGAAGLAATMTAKALGARIIVVADPDADRRSLASDLGATLTVHTDEDLAAAVKSLTGAGAAFALDTTGHAAAIEACMASLAPDGLCGSLAAPETPAPRILDLSHGPGLPHAVVQILVGWHAEGGFPLEKLIAFFPFEHINDALEALADKRVVKPVVRFALGPFDAVDRANVEGAMADAPVEEPESGGGNPVDAPLVPLMRDGVA